MSEDCQVEKKNETTLLANVSKEYSINELYGELTRRDIKVLSMRNKTNRLEELFVSLKAMGFRIRPKLFWQIFGGIDQKR